MAAASASGLRHGSGVSAEESAFLESASADTDYHVETVVEAALSVGAVALALHVAHERDFADKCVERIVALRLLPPTRQELQLIAKAGALSLPLLSAVPSCSAQLRVVAGGALRLVGPVVRNCLPQMTPDDLLFAEALLHSVSKSSDASAAATAAGGSQAAAAAAASSEHAELYAAVVLALVAKCGLETADDGSGREQLRASRHDSAAAAAAAPQVLSGKHVISGSSSSSSSSSSSELGQPRIISVASGWNHSVCVAADGSVYAWGKCDTGALGLGLTHTVEQLRASKAYCTPSLVVFGDRVIVQSVSCGGDHSTAVDAEGRLFAWGLNDHGQLGTGDKTNCDAPRLVAGPPPIKASACGHSHSLFLDVRGRVWACGLDDDGQVTGTTAGRDVLLLTDLSAQLQLGSKKILIVGVVCGYAHSAFWSADDVFTCGNNVYGQLGRAPPSAVALARVTETIGSKRIHHVSCGSFHTLAVTDLGSVYEWGGKGNWKPRMMDGLVGRRVVEVAGGHTWSMCRAAQGEVLAWMHNSKDVAALKVFDGCRSVACGEDFFVVVAGHVFAWGNGSWGQLGVEEGKDTISSEVPLRVRFPHGGGNNNSSSSNGFGALLPQVDKSAPAVLYQHKLYDAILQQGTKHSAVWVELCNGYANWAALAAVHLRQGRFVLAFFSAARARSGVAHEGLLAVLEDWVHQGRVVFDAAYPKCERMLSGPLTPGVRAQLLWHALWRWRDCALPTAPLVAWLEACLAASTEVAGIVRQLMVSPPPPRAPPAGCPLVVELPWDTLLRAAAQRSPETKREAASLWESIHSNLSKALDRDFVTVSAKTMGESFVFSCGHVVAAENFQTALSTLKRALDDLPQWRGAPSQLIFQEYASKSPMLMSCPRCVQSSL